MRWLAQLGVGLFGLALAGPAWSQSVPSAMDAPGVAALAPAMSRHNHKGLFGWRSCAECQRARAKARDGVDVPPPPSSVSLPPGTVIHGHGHPQGNIHPQAMVSHVQEGACSACEQAAGGVVISGPITTPDPTVPGYASVGGNSAAGYASVGGEAAPSPIGVARAHSGSAGPAGGFAGRSGPGTQDSSVMPTNAEIPAAPTPMGDTGPVRPNVLGHLFGFSDIARERRERRGQKAEKERAKHAAIAYDEKPQAITEIPASMVYGQAGHQDH